MHFLLRFVIALAVVPSNAWASAPREVFFFNWTEYLPDKVIQKFEKETGIKVHYSTYDSNEHMYAKIKLQKKAEYDLIVPSSYFVDKMRREGLLEKIDHGKLKNFKNLEPSFLNRSFDPGSSYSIPYMWGATVLTLNSKKVDPKLVTSWQDLWRPEFKKQILMLNDPREVFFIALKSLGYSGNTKNPKEIEAAYLKLKDLMPNIKIFESNSPKTAFLADEIQIGAIWNGEAFMANRENPDIVGILPKDGLYFFMDNLVIPKGAKNQTAAYQLIDFILRPEISKEIAEELGYSSPNREALKLIDPKIRDNPLVYPPLTLVQKGEFQEDVGSAMTLYEGYWEKLKAQK